tara:strand:- start:51180 stop:55583 length:4404 start_codon:yes stop_codon:yes gene_type:complete
MIDRFQNPNIVTDTKTPIDSVPVFSALDLSKLVRLNLPSDSATQFPPAENIMDNAFVETHIYSAGNLIESLPSYELKYTTADSSADYTYDILNIPEYDIRQANLNKGYYSIVYNYVKPITSELKIDRISADGTELELSPFDNSENVSSLYALIGFGGFANNNKENLALNFGNNELSIVTDVRFDNNKRVGEIVKSFTPSNGFPTDSFSDGPITTSTKFYPTLQDSDDNFWIEITDTSFNLAGNTTGNKTTGRAAKFILTPILDVDGNVTDVTLVQEKDTNGNPIYYTNDTSDLSRYYNIVADFTYTGDFIIPEFKVRYFDASIDTSNPNNLKKIVVKLYKPLSPTLENINPIMHRIVRDSKIERIILYPAIVEQIQNNFSPPNFTLNLTPYGQSAGTDLQSWNSLLDANLSTSQQIIDKYISSSFGNINVNVDYTDFGNFVHFSSAVERVRNFKYKLELIQSFNNRITTLQSVSGSNALTNISQSITRRDAVVSGFDGFEKFLYYETTGSLYTHYSSSAFSISPWPKTSEYPLELVSTTSTLGTNHYNGLIDSASIFDASNDARLTKLIPASIAEDSLNLEYVLFIDMVGHHFDITWSYIKKLTSIHEREEHPFDGMPNELLYDVAKSMGWQLTNSKQTSDLWKYALGTDNTGTPLQSGSLSSKSDEQITYEVWRRIVNTLPYLLKTKGTARSVKALISTYGIPQTFLNIKEYGGPVVDGDVKPIWEHDRFVYNLRMNSPSYVSVPWDKMTDINPVTYVLDSTNSMDTIELQFKQNVQQKTTLLYKTGSSSIDFLVLLEPTGSNDRGNIHLYLSGSSGYKSASISDVKVFDSNMNSFFLQRNTSVDNITQNNSYTIHYRRNRTDEISVRKSASISINGSSEPSYNAAWTGSGAVLIGNPTVPASGVPSLWASSNYLSGSIQEIRYYTNPLSEIVMDEHTLSREMYHGNSPTASFFDLKFRYITDSQLKSVTNPYGVLSQHPNQQITSSQDGRIVSASLFGFDSTDLLGVVDEYYTKVPSAAFNNILNNKVRIESSTLTGNLDVDNKKEKSAFDRAPIDSNLLGIYLSATSMYNDDIYNHTGHFELDDFIGDPDFRDGYNDTNAELDHLRRQVFRKYSSRNLIDTVIDLLSRYDLSVFKQIKQLLPARVKYQSGILIEPHILERPKVKSKTKVSYTQPQYKLVLKQNDKPPSGEYTNYQTTLNIDVSDNMTGSNIMYNATFDIGNNLVVTAQRDDLESVGTDTVSTQYTPSVYEYTILNYSQSSDIGFGINWTTGSNGIWNYNPIGISIVNGVPSVNASTTNFFYSSSISASLGLFYSSSLTPAVTSTDNLPLSLDNLFFNGCSVTSDSITTDSTQTPDGGPVVEVFNADPNTLVVTSQNAVDGNLTLGAAVNIPTLLLDDLVINSQIQFQQQQEYNVDLNEFRKNLQNLIKIEEERIKEFDLNFSLEKLRQDTEDTRRNEFDIKNGK